MAGHTCASCGKFRSPRYQKHHPLAPGEIPRIDFCRKCAKRATESSEGRNCIDMSRTAARRHRCCKQRNRVRRYSYCSDTSDNNLSSDRERGFQQTRPNFKRRSRSRAVRVRASSGSRRWHQGYPPRDIRIGAAKSSSSDDLVIVQRTNSRGDVDSSVFFHQDIFDGSSSSVSAGPVIARSFYRGPQIPFEHRRSLTEEVTVLPFRKRQLVSTIVEPKVYYQRRRIFATDPTASFFPEDFYVGQTCRHQSRSGRGAFDVVRPPNRLVYVDSNRRSSAGSIAIQGHAVRAKKPHHMKVANEPCRIRKLSSTSQVVGPELSRVGTPVMLSTTAGDPIGENIYSLLEFSPNRLAFV